MQIFNPFPSLRKRVFPFAFATTISGGETMPSEKILEQKKQIVNDLADTLSSSVAGVSLLRTTQSCVRIFVRRASSTQSSRTLSSSLQPRRPSFPISMMFLRAQPLSQPARRTTPPLPASFANLQAPARPSLLRRASWTVRS